MATQTFAETDSIGLKDDGVIRQLQQILGPDHVLLDAPTREFYSTDLSWRPHEIASIGGVSRQTETGILNKAFKLKACERTST